MKFSYLFTLLLCVLSPCGTFAADDVNIALARWGATATASSEFGPDYRAGNALDGLWTSREHHKWNSKLGETPHWLSIDFGHTVAIHRIVVRHEGIYGDGESFNTSDYRLQISDSPEGPWCDIIDPVRGNTEDVNDFSFPPTRMRYLRLFIEMGEQGANDYARIFEVETWANRSELSAPMMHLTTMDHVKRKSANSFDIGAELEIVFPSDIQNGTKFAVKSGNDILFTIDKKEAFGTHDLWLPATKTPDGTGTVSLVMINPDGEKVLGNVDYNATDPGYFTDGTVHVISSSHQDIGWMDTPEQCIIDRDRLVITPALERMQENPQFRFVMESTMNLMEYLDRHPESRDEIAHYTREGRFAWGATYNQPYESMYAGEALVRQVYLGRKWLRKTLPGCDTREAWSPDVPGRAMQMPQILSKAGVPYLIMSRHEEGLFNWESPDGSSVTAYSPGHYHASGEIFRKGIERGDDHTTIIQKTKSFNEVWQTLYPALSEKQNYYSTWKLKPEVGIVVSTDFSGPVNFDDLFSEWNAAVDRGYTDKPETAFIMPRLTYATGTTFLDAVTKNKPKLKTIVGERPDVWLYIHGPTHRRALTAGREAWRMLTAAETFATFDALVTGSFQKYPSERLEKAWMAAIYPDHGWGGFNGAITDRLFRTKMEAGRNAGRDMLENALTSIAAKIAVKDMGTPYVVFNPLPQERTDIVRMNVDVYGHESAGFRILDFLGREVAFQRVTTESSGESRDETVEVVFVADKVPSLGYSVCYVVPIQTIPERKPNNVSGNENPVIDNNFYHIELTGGGIASLVDKELGQDILNTDKFLGGELFGMQSEGNGAGEFASVQQPTMEGFERLSNYAPRWNLIEDGPVRTVFRTECLTRHCTVVQHIIAYHTVKRIDVEVDLLGWDGTKSREYRLAFPIAVENGTVSYDAPMGVVEVGKSEIDGAAGERYTDNASDVHPREVQEWFNASDDNLGVTVSSSVAVFDWIDPTDNPVDYPVLQPLLLASRRSCHGEGNWYLQAGDHHFAFSLFSGREGWCTGFVQGVRHNNPLITVPHPRRGETFRLPETLSFASTGDSSVVISALKKCEDDNSVVMRVYEITGNNTETELKLFVPVETAFSTDIIEENPQPAVVQTGTVQATVGHHAIETYKLTPGRWRADARSLIPPSPPIADPPGGVYADSQLNIRLSGDSDTVIHYTTDGTEPTPASQQYNAPLKLGGNFVLTARAYRGRTASSVPVVTEYRIGLTEPVAAGNVKSGLAYGYFEGSWEKMPDFAAMKPLKQGIVPNFGFDPAKNTDMEQFGLSFTGLVKVPKDGIYTFEIESDDGGMLYVDGLLIANNDGRHWPQTASGDIGLKAGLHRIRVDFFEAGGGEALKVRWSGPGFEMTEVSGDVLFCE
ncbi:MAG: discoidin domain-containing protein [Candidatus Latescibacteria bacterium]|nr:discoidin domain-containing protein [Candidatus Latescibacterota bacterium]